MRNTVLTLLAATLLFAACTTRNQREKLLQEITQSEKEIFSKNDVTMEESQHLMDLYLTFADEFPQDSLSPEFLFSCANIALNTQQEKFAITLYQRVYDGYPDHAFRPIALLHQALAYDNMGDVEHAKPLYEQFLVLFPDNPFISDVEYLLEMVDKSPDEWEFIEDVDDMD